MHLAMTAVMLATFNFAQLDVRRKARLQRARMGFVDADKLNMMSKAERRRRAGVIVWHVS